MTVSLSVVGAPVAVASTFYDSSNPPALFDPASVSVNITDPAGATTTSAATKVTTGKYAFAYTPSLSGVFTFWFTSTSPVSEQLPDVFTVVPATSGALVSLADARAQLGKTSTANDVELRGYILAASEMITRLCGPTNAQAVVTERVTANSGTLVLSTAPVQSVTSVTPSGWFDATVLDPSTYTVYNEAGLISKADGTWFTSPATVVYTPGRSVVPASLQEACLLIVQQMWETKRGGAATIPGQGGDDAPTEASGIMLTPRVAELLQPFRLPPGVR